MIFGVMTTHDPESLGGMQAATSWLIDLIKSSGHSAEVISYPLAKWEQNTLLWAALGEPLRMCRLSLLARKMVDSLDRVIIQAPAGYSHVPGVTIHHINTLEYAYNRYSPWNLNHWKLRWLNTFYDKVSSYGQRKNIAVSYGQANWLTKSGIKIDDVIYYATDTELYRPIKDKSEPRRSLKLPERTFTICCLGRLDGRKNWDRIISLANALSHFTFVFAGPKQSAFKTLPSNCVTMGPLEKTQTAKLYQASDLFLTTSYSEANALTWLEALSSGLPVVATPIGASQDLISFNPIYKKSITDFSFSNQLQTILYLHENQGLRNEMSEIGRQFILERAEAKQVASKFLNILDIKVSI